MRQRQMHWRRLAAILRRWRSGSRKEKLKVQSESTAAAMASRRMTLLSCLLSFHAEEGRHLCAQVMYLFIAFIFLISMRRMKALYCIVFTALPNPSHKTKHHKPPCHYTEHFSRVLLPSIHQVAIECAQETMRQSKVARQRRRH